MDSFNRLAYIAAITAVLQTATDEQVDYIWCATMNMVIQNEEAKKHDRA